MSTKGFNNNQWSDSYEERFSQGVCLPVFGDLLLISGQIFDH